MCRGAAPDRESHKRSSSILGRSSLQISRYAHARGVLRTICRQRRQTRPSIAGALHSNLACSSNITPSISLGSTSCMRSGSFGSIHVYNQYLSECRLSRSGARTIIPDLNSSYILTRWSATCLWPILIWITCGPPPGQCFKVSQIIVSPPRRSLHSAL
jgi:hypothetical protein